MRAPPAMNPDEMSVPRLLRRSASSLSLVDVLTRWEMKPPTRSGVVSGSGRYMPRAKASGGTLASSATRATEAPDGVEEPGHGLARHHRLDDRGHQVGLGRGQGPALEGEGLVEDVDGDARRSGRETRTPANLNRSWLRGVAPSQ